MDFQALSDLASVAATLPTSQQTLNDSLVSANSEQVRQAATSPYVRSILCFSDKVKEDQNFVSNHFTTNDTTEHFGDQSLPDLCPHLLKINEHWNFNTEIAKRSLRIRYSREQLYRLERVFAVNPYPQREVKSELCRSLGLTGQQLTNWFQNRRNKAKKKRNNRLHSFCGMHPSRRNPELNFPPPIEPWDDPLSVQIDHFHTAFDNS